MQLLLNPYDKNDSSILDTISSMLSGTKTDSKNLNIVLAEKLSLLLKHDWERAKREALPFWCKRKCSSIVRVSYDDFIKKHSTDNH